jgi:hypothetical protein
LCVALTFLGCLSWLSLRRAPYRGAAICQVSACGGMFSTTWQPLQSNVCNADSAPKLGEVRLNCIGELLNGQRGFGASASMHQMWDRRG